MKIPRKYIDLYVNLYFRNPYIVIFIFLKKSNCMNVCIENETPPPKKMSDNMVQNYVWETVSHPC